MAKSVRFRDSDTATHVVFTPAPATIERGDVVPELGNIGGAMVPRMAFVRQIGPTFEQALVRVDGVWPPVTPEEMAWLRVHVGLCDRCERADVSRRVFVVLARGPATEFVRSIVVSRLLGGVGLRRILRAMESLIRERHVCRLWQHAGHVGQGSWCGYRLTQKARIAFAGG